MVKKPVSVTLPSVRFTRPKEDVLIAGTVYPKNEILMARHVNLAKVEANSNNDRISDKNLDELVATLALKPLDIEHKLGSMIGFIPEVRRVGDHANIDMLIYTKHTPEDVQAGLLNGEYSVSVEAGAEAAVCSVCTKRFTTQDDYCSHINTVSAKKKHAAYRDFDGLYGTGGAVVKHPAASDSQIASNAVSFLASQEPLEGGDMAKCSKCGKEKDDLQGGVCAACRSDMKAAEEKKDKPKDEKEDEPPSEEEKDDKEKDDKTKDKVKAAASHDHEHHHGEYAHSHSHEHAEEAMHNESESVPHRHAHTDEHLQAMKAFMAKHNDSDNDNTSLSGKKYSAEERQEMAKKGEAKSDGSFPIHERGDVVNAVHDWGRAGATASDKAHIIARAKAIGAEDALPDDWVKGAVFALADLLAKIGEQVVALTKQQDTLRASAVAMTEDVKAARVEARRIKLVESGLLTEDEFKTHTEQLAQTDDKIVSLFASKLSDKKSKRPMVSLFGSPVERKEAVTIAATEAEPPQPQVKLKVG
jgi:hypothetical protein